MEAKRALLPGTSGCHGATKVVTLAAERVDMEVKVVDAVMVVGSVVGMMAVVAVAVKEVVAVDEVKAAEVMV